MVKNTFTKQEVLLLFDAMLDTMQEYRSELSIGRRYGYNQAMNVVSSTRRLFAENRLTICDYEALELYKVKR